MPSELHAATRALRDFLGRNGEGRWASTLATALHQHEADMAALATSVLKACDDGLGRLTLSPIGGHAVMACSIDGTNRALHGLRKSLRAEADAVLAA